MKLSKLKINDVVLLEPNVFEDERGYFLESYNKGVFNSAIGADINFVQDNFSKSHKGVLRGLHYQKKPFEQGKLVSVLEGSVFDVAVDIRKNSPTFGNWVGEILSSENRKQLWIPEGFAHGFVVLSDIALFQYKTTNFYNKDSEVIISYEDPEIDIQWPIVDSYYLSDKDKKGMSLNEFKLKDL